MMHDMDFKYVLKIKCTGEELNEFDSYWDALDELELYELADMRLGTYEQDTYEIVVEDAFDAAVAEHPKQSVRCSGRKKRNKKSDDESRRKL